MRRKDLWEKIEKSIQFTGHKQYKYLYRRMLDEEVIRKAYKKLRKGKTKRKEIQYIDAHLDSEVAKMKEMIRNTKPPDVPVEHPELAFCPRKHRERRRVEHGKMRTYIVPAIKEQWVHHIIVQILAPIVTRTAYPYSCGSFPKRGAHYGKRHIEKWIRTGKDIKYFAKADIRHFYDNIRLDILMQEMAARIKDDWFLYIIRLCYRGKRKGLALGLYISQWLANYLLEPLDRLISAVLGIRLYVRYMDDIVFFAGNKKGLRGALAEIMHLIGGRLRLRLKRNYQICRFHFVKKSGAETGRKLDCMGFLFFRNRVTIRKRIMLTVTRLAARMHRAKRWSLRRIRAMISGVGWFSHTDSYDCYLDRIKPCVNIGRLKDIVSRADRRKNRHDRMERRTLLIAA